MVKHTHDSQAKGGKLGPRHKARRTAVQALYQWDITDQSADVIRDHFIETEGSKGVDTSYLAMLISEVPQYCEELEAALEPFIDRPFNSLDPIERAILRLASYELMHQLEVPPKVVINEAIELAKVFGAEHSFRYVNGVLDKLAESSRC
ncbi:MAG TPA: transcription antitermination factor NusB [Gammaproteobacteria bacterium]|jgi:transcription antitermination protein NusB|nr:transcription antitermination factor NusB [Gammaproteobacteria bacterium]